MMTKEEKAAYDKAYYQANREKLIAKNNIYYHANKEKILAKKAAYYQANREKVIAGITKYREANPEKRKAHTAVANAIRSGKLVSLPCSECGETKTEAHHYAYDMPLDVIWLCRKHHKQLHKEHRSYEQVP